MEWGYCIGIFLLYRTARHRPEKHPQIILQSWRTVYGRVHGVYGYPRQSRVEEDDEEDDEEEDDVITHNLAPLVKLATNNKPPTRQSQ